MTIPARGKTIGKARPITLLCLLLLTAAACKKVIISEEEVHRRIKSELPPGSTNDQVNDFLKRQNWVWDPNYMAFEDGGTLENMLTVEEKRRIRWFTAGGIRGTEKTVLGETGILIHFYYDQGGKLVTYRLLSYHS